MYRAYAYRREDPKSPPLLRCPFNIPDPQTSQPPTPPQNCGTHFIFYLHPSSS